MKLLEISIIEGFGHAMSFAGYWVWLAIALATVFCAWRFIVKPDTDANGWSLKHLLILFVAAALILSALLIAPAEIAANTTKEQAARGVYIR